MSCALELLEAALGPGSGGSYRALVAADEADRAVGYACFGATPMTEATFDLYWIVLGPSERGLGLGRRLLDAVESHLRERGARLVRVETSSLDGKGGAPGFYRKAGYTEVGLIRDFYLPGDDLIILAKGL